MGYEAAGIYRVPSPLPQGHFPDGERADSSEPRLQHHEPDGGNVGQTEPGVAHPGPVQQFAQQNGNQAEDDKPNKKHMGEQDQVGCEEVELFGFHDAI